MKILLFYFRSLAAPALAITLACSAIVLHYHDIGPVFPFFGFKIFTTVLLFYFWSAFRANQLYYYQNLGLRKKHLFLFALIFDLLLFVLIQWFTVLWI